MSKPKMISIKPKAVSTVEKKQQEQVPVQKVDSTDLEFKLNAHINDKEAHVDTDLRDAVTYLRKDVDKHVANDDIHVTKQDKLNWNNKETPNGAQAKVNKVLTSLDLHKEDRSCHITKAEKDLLKDKYTRSETRNLLKHGLTGLIFLPSISSRTELETKYPTPKFNSCVYIRKDKTNVVYNGEKWIDFNVVLNPEVTKEYDGLMTSEDKIKLDTIEEGSNKYVHPDNIDTRHVTDAQISFWNEKADSTLVTQYKDGLMTSEDKIKLDTIEEGSNNYKHPEFHEPSVIKEDESHRFVTDEEKENWTNKPSTKYVDAGLSKTLTQAKSFTDTKIASMINSTESQLQVLRSLAFEMKKDDVVKKFFDLFNECTKTKEFQAHNLNDKIHITNEDRSILKSVNEALQKGLNSDWNETDTTSTSYIANKPKALPADGGNADTISGYKATDLINNRSLYDYVIGTTDYTIDQASVLVENKTIKEELAKVLKVVNKGQAYSILFKPGTYNLNSEILIKTSNATISGVGDASKITESNIRIIGNNNTIENLTLTNRADSIVNKTAIYIEGNNNTIKNSTIMNYSNGILVEGSNNTIIDNKFVNIRNAAVELTAENNTNYGNLVDHNEIVRSGFGIVLLSNKNFLYRNRVTKNNVFNCNIGITLSNKLGDRTKTTSNMINENMVIRGRGEESDYFANNQTITSEFSSKNIISLNTTSGKEILAPNDILSNNVY